MRITYLLVASALLVSAHALAQPCNLNLKDGSKMTLLIKTWTNPHMSDSKFLKMKDEKQAEVIGQYNAQVRSGALPPASNYPLTYSVHKTTIPAGDEYTVGTEIAGKMYYSYVVCNNDTLYIARNRGPIEVPDGKGGIFGYSIQGIQILPMNLKVGDTPPSFQDLNIVFPTSTDVMVKKNVFSHTTSKTTNEFGYATDSRTGETFNGAYTKTTSVDVYKTIDVEVRKTMSSSGHSVHYMNARVIDEEEVTVGGKTYKAFVIDSESWSKQTNEVSIETADEEVKRQQEAFHKKVQTKMDKFMVKKAFTNELGYMVFYKREWFVPAIGMVKVEAYDMFGGLSSITLMEGLE
jgi:hypothetical protein